MEPARDVKKACGYFSAGTFGKDDVVSSETSMVHENNGKNTGRWTSEEHKDFLHGLQLFGKNWKKIATKVRTRTPVQIRTHAQKYFLKRERKRNLGEKKVDTSKEKAVEGSNSEEFSDDKSLSVKRSRLNMDGDNSTGCFGKKVGEDLTELDFDAVAGEAFRHNMDLIPPIELFEDDPFVLPSEYDLYTPKYTSAMDKPFYDFNFEKGAAKHQGLGFHRALGLHLDPLLGHDAGPIEYKRSMDLFDYPSAHEADALLFDV